MVPFSCAAFVFAYRLLSSPLTTTYLIDNNNFTGYSQTIEQTEDDTVDTKTTYILGTDVVGQYVTVEGAGTQGAVFLADGRGSTRGLYDPASEALLNAAQVSGGGASTKVLNYDAYGNAVGFDPATAATEMLYNGEAFNARTGQQYLRARWYNPSVGGFGEGKGVRTILYAYKTREGKGVRTILYAYKTSS